MDLGCPRIFCANNVIVANKHLYWKSNQMKIQIYLLILKNLIESCIPIKYDIVCHMFLQFVIFFTDFLQFHIKFILRSQKVSLSVKVFTLYVAEPALIFNTPYGFLSPTRIDPVVCSQQTKCVPPTKQFYFPKYFYFLLLF